MPPTSSTRSKHPLSKHDAASPIADSASLPAPPPPLISAPTAIDAAVGRARRYPLDVCVSRSTFFANICYLRELVTPGKLCVVMKANAYGHGIGPLAPVAVAAGADMIGICTNHEAAIIREQGFEIPIFRLRMGLPDELEEGVLELGVEEEVGTLEQAEFLAGLSRRLGRPARVHLNIDTGMGRSGFLPQELETVRRVCQMPGLRIAGVFTHFASADSADLASTLKSIERFEQTLQSLADVLPDDAIVHTHNSAATVRLPGRPRMVRCGAACFGVRTSTDFDNPAALRPVMSIKTHVAQVRDVPAGTTIGYGGLFTTRRPSRIASLPVGFGEGYPRALFNKGIVLIHGQRCPVVGRVSLNIITVDVTDLGAGSLGRRSGARGPPGQ